MQVYAMITLFLLNISFLLFYNQAITNYIHRRELPKSNAKDQTKDTVPEYSMFN